MTLSIHRFISINLVSPSEVLCQSQSMSRPQMTDKNVKKEIPSSADTRSLVGHRPREKRTNCYMWFLSSLKGSFLFTII